MLLSPVLCPTRDHHTIDRVFYDKLSSGVLHIDAALLLFNSQLSPACTVLATLDTDEPFLDQVSCPQVVGNSLTLFDLTSAPCNYAAGLSTRGHLRLYCFGFALCSAGKRFGAFA
eukprot:6172430-Pleurochrysis_carterae.AAC.3